MRDLARFRWPTFCECLTSFPRVPRVTTNLWASYQDIAGLPRSWPVGAIGVFYLGQTDPSFLAFGPRSAVVVVI